MKTPKKPRGNRNIKISRLLGSIPTTRTSNPSIWKDQRSAMTARNKKVKVTLAKTPWDPERDEQ